MSRHTFPVPRGILRLLGVAGSLVATGACAPGYSEAGYLLHEDASYEEVFDTGELFGPVSSNPSGMLALDSRDLSTDRNYLRYRIIVSKRYYTVHGRRDPRIPIPTGSITLGVQPIDVSNFVSGTRARYGIPRQVTFDVAPGETVHVRLRSDGSDELRVEVVEPEGRSRRDSAAARDSRGGLP